MRCPKCGFENDKVIDSRATMDGAGVRRRRECLQCFHRFTTHEEIVPAELKVIKRNGERVPFDLNKLRSGIAKACWKRDVSDSGINDAVASVTAGLEADFDKEVSSEEIGERVMEALKKIDKVAYVRFASVYRDFKDIDEFISEIRAMGKKSK